MGQKLKFVLSDLHIGAGHPGEVGNPLEDFCAGEALVELLHKIWHESEGKQCEIELIINGDLFEFLQVPSIENYDPTVAYPQDLYLDACEEASVKRLNIIADGNPDIFNALSDFMHVEYPQRRITIIKGNHDVHLFWPGVKNRLREILGASGTRASLLRFANEFVSREKIYVEHGHQRAEQINGYPDAYDPRTPNDSSQIYYPIGSRFTIDFINKVEADCWFTDNVKPITSLIWYALSQDFYFAANALTCFIQHAEALGMLEQFNAPLLQHLKDDDQRLDMLHQYAVDPAFRREFHGQIQHLFHQAHADIPPLPLPEVSDNPVEMGRAYQTQQQTLLCQAAEKIADQEGARVVLFGHTHHPIQETLSNGALYINTGSWIENFFDAPLETWEALFEGLHRPGDTLSGLPYARIEYDENNIPSAQLLYFDRRAQADTFTPEEAAAQEIVPKGFFGKN